MSTASYERATTSYDEDHETELVNAVLAAIVNTSKVTDVNAVVLRTGEIGNALVSALACVLALSPAVMRSPTTIRNTTEEIRKRLLRRVSATANDPEMVSFKARCFNGDDTGGHA
jgi:hypothetical protein